MIIIDSGKQKNPLLTNLYFTCFATIRAVSQAYYCKFVVIHTVSFKTKNFYIFVLEFTCILREGKKEIQTETAEK